MRVGRPLTFVARFSAEAHAIDPNKDVLRDAREWLPGIQFHQGRAQELSYPDDHFDFVVCWTVLQHIPEEGIVDDAEESKRVLQREGVLLLFENPRAKKSRPPVWRRPEERYEELFAPLQLKRSFPRVSSHAQGL